MSEVIINSCESGNKLIFSNNIGEYFDVRYESPSVRVSRTVWKYNDYSLLVGFFETIATQWKGWDYPIEWVSVEGELSLSATSDSLGHALIAIGLNQHDETEEWSVSITLKINTTQAGDIVNKLMSL